MAGITVAAGVSPEVTGSEARGAGGAGSSPEEGAGGGGGALRGGDGDPRWRGGGGGRRARQRGEWWRRVTPSMRLYLLRVKARLRGITALKAMSQVR